MKTITKSVALLTLALSALSVHAGQPWEVRIDRKIDKFTSGAKEKQDIFSQIITSANGTPSYFCSATADSFETDFPQTLKVENACQNVSVSKEGSVLLIKGQCPKVETTMRLVKKGSDEYQGIAQWKGDFDGAGFEASGPIVITKKKDGTCDMNPRK